MPKKYFTNLSNVLGRPISEDVSPEELEQGLDEAFTGEIKNRGAEVDIGGKKFVKDPFQIKQDLMNEYMRAYISDMYPNLKLPKSNEPASREEIQELYNTLKYESSAPDVPLELAPKEKDIGGAYSPSEKKIYYTGGAESLSETPRIFQHEQQHAKDAQSGRPASKEEKIEQNVLRELPRERGLYSTLGTEELLSGEHFAPGGIEKQYGMPFLGIKQRLLDKITKKNQF